MKNKLQLRNYATDSITNILCNKSHQENSIGNSSYNFLEMDKIFIKEISKFSKKDLAYFIIDNFNRNSLNSMSISKIPQQEI